MRVALLQGAQQLGDLGHQPQMIPVGVRTRQQLTWGQWRPGTVISAPSVRTGFLPVESDFTQPLLNQCRREEHPMAPMQPPDQLQRLGDIEIVREIGRGVMGVVY
jgi:hypothetical protein